MRGWIGVRCEIKKWKRTLRFMFKWLTGSPSGQTLEYPSSINENCPFAFAKDRKLPAHLLPASPSGVGTIGSTKPYIFWGSQLDHVATLEIYGIVQRHFLLSWLRRGGNANIQWVETKDTAKHPTRYRIALSKSYLTQNINSFEPEKLCSTLKTQLFDSRGTS